MSCFVTEDLEAIFMSSLVMVHKNSFNILRYKTGDKNSFKILRYKTGHKQRHDPP
jgi:hypothetical protein